MNTSSNTIIPLESIQIATPCRADWDKMSGDDQSRFCGSCAKNVYNLSAMSRDEAQRLILEKEGHLCVQLHRRADGTIITSDCAVGISPMHRSAGAFRSLMAASVAAVLGVFGIRSSQAVESSGAKPKVAQPVNPEMTAEMGIVGPPQTTPKTKEQPQVIMGKPVMPSPTATPKPAPHRVTMGMIAIPVKQPKPKQTTKPAPKKNDAAPKSAR
ncbi:hypothetical protein EON80_02535 [bacterium]|nr:MAG: hypothetical protein EON80_02535 [bacterium]